MTDTSRVAARMLALSFHHDDDAVRALAAEHPDPAALAVAVAQASRHLLADLAIRPDGPPMFSLADAYHLAQHLAND